MLDELFNFPVVMIDGDNEERKMKDKQKLGDLLNSESEEEEYDIIYGEAEYPYWDFVGIEDRWLPSTESWEKAQDGKFEACIVRFLHVGQLLVPWSRKRFKAEIKKFADAYEIAHPKQTDKKVPELRIMAITPEQYKQATEDGNKEDDGNIR